MMSEIPGPETDPPPPAPAGGAQRLTRRRVGSAKFALAVLLAVLITAATIMILFAVLQAVGVIH